MHCSKHAKIPQAFFCCAAIFAPALRWPGHWDKCRKNRPNKCMFDKGESLPKEIMVGWLVMIHMFICWSWKLPPIKNVTWQQEKTKYLNKTTRNNYSYRLKLKPLKMSANSGWHVAFFVAPTSKLHELPTLEASLLPLVGELGISKRFRCCLRNRYHLDDLEWLEVIWM